MLGASYACTLSRMTHTQSILPRTEAPSGLGEGQAPLDESSDHKLHAGTDQHAVHHLLIHSCNNLECSVGETHIQICIIPHLRLVRPRTFDLIFCPIICKALEIQVFKSSSVGRSTGPSGQTFWTFWCEWHAVHSERRNEDGSHACTSTCPSHACLSRLSVAQVWL